MDPTDPALLDVDWENQFGTLQLESGPLDPIVASLMGLNIGSQRRKRDSRSPESLVGRIRLNSNAANGSHHDTEGSGYWPRRRRSSSPDSPPTRRSSSSSSSNQGEPVPPGPTIGQFGTTMDTRRWQFWPHAMAMGSLTGRELTSVSFDPDKKTGRALTQYPFVDVQRTLPLWSRPHSPR